MVVELPDPKCIAAGGRFWTRIAAARAALQHRRKFQAPNGIELHPVLSVKFP
jgi:hypothetical protein